MSHIGTKRHLMRCKDMSEVEVIVLQKSKVAGSRIFRENTKREAIADLCRRNRVVEVACEFNVRR
jgi:hypothetical protein